MIATMVFAALWLAHAPVGAGSHTHGVAVSAAKGTFAAELAAVDEEIARARSRAESREREAEPRVRWAELLLERARLTGCFQDYADAETRIAEAFDRSPAGAGPFRQRALLHLAVHRVGEAAADLARCRQAAVLLPDERDRIGRAELDLLVQQGRIDEAWDVVGAGLAVATSDSASPRAESFDDLSCRALLAAAVGDDQQADALYAQAERAYHGVRSWPRAWVHLARGLLDLEAGDPKAALGHFATADQALPGWWRVEEQSAIALRQLRRTEEAERLYLSLAERAPWPSVFGALAELTRDRGDAAQAAEWARRAVAAQAERAALFPEAARGHAHDHDPTRRHEQDHAHDSGHDHSPGPGHASDHAHGRTHGHGQAHDDAHRSALDRD